jgi:serralysin
VMNAGAGADTFVFQSVADTGTVSHPDIITGFTSGQDVIDLSAIAHTALGAGHSLTFLGSGAFTHVAGQVDYILTSSGLTIQGDLNGDGVADFSLLLSHTTAIAGHDLVLG